MRDGAADPVSLDQILRHARGQEKIIFPVQLITSRIGNLTRLIYTLLYVMTTHTLPPYLCVCVCVFSSHSFWTSSSLDVPAGVTQEEGHT